MTYPEKHHFLNTSSYISRYPVPSLLKILGRLKLASQFTLLLSLIFISGIALGGFALSQALEKKAEAEIDYRAQMAIQMVTAVKSYTNNYVAPRFAEIVDLQTRAIPETVSNFAAREVFNAFKEIWKYKDFVYKDATLNPTNLKDQADRFEAKLIEHFASDRTIKTLSGFHSQFDKQLFYSAQPLTVTNSSCLQCHSLPKLAPKSHVAKYGTQHGYGWQVNQVIGTQIIYIPAAEVTRNARKALLLFISIFIGIFALVLASINYLLKWRVIQPLKPMVQLAETMSLNPINANEVNALETEGLSKIAQRPDELGRLARVFQQMVHEVRDREQHLSEQLQQLKIEVDQTKVKNQVAEIANAEYFQRLQQAAKDIRNQWNKDE